MLRRKIETVLGSLGEVREGFLEEVVFDLGADITLNWVGEYALGVIRATERRR